jgi:hypothetical protein
MKAFLRRHRVQLASLGLVMSFLLVVELSVAAGPARDHDQQGLIPAMSYTPYPEPTEPPDPTPGPSTSPSPTPSAAAQLLNISTRLQVETGQDVAIAGFIITGSGPKRVAMRALGPSLESAGVTNVLKDPALELYGPSGDLMMSNDNWRDDGSAAAELMTSGVAPTNDSEAAIATMMGTVSYTAVMAGHDGGIGKALVDVYDLQQSSSSRIANISTRGRVRPGDGVMIGGFILGKGSAPTRIIVRGIGPSLGPAIADALTDPMLALHDSNGVVIGSNDDWQQQQRAEIEATGIPPQDGREAAVVTQLGPGGYTAVLSGKNGGSGVGLVEVYDLH